VGLSSSVFMLLAFMGNQTKWSHSIQGALIFIMILSNYTVL